MSYTFRTLLAAITLVAWTGIATADDVGGTGTLVGLQINTSASDTYLQYHGRGFVKNVSGGLDEYRWGGTSCGSRTLTEPQMAALQAALDNPKVRVQPLYQNGQGQSLCLVGVTLVPKAALKLVLP